jgi:uncharacterized protein YigE (DUF2233 family)
MRLARGLIFLVLAAIVPILSFAAPKQSDTGVQIRQLEHQGNKYVVVSVDLKKAKLKMFWKDKQNQPFKTFQKLEQHLTKNGVKLLAAMNAGIFDKTYTPLGLHIQRGQKLHKLNSRTNAFGNFYMQPNGIFFLDARGANILSTQDFVRSQANAIEATQSGPMLVLNNKINSKFQKNSSNQLVRNGVGVETGSRVHLVIAQSWVSFYEFAAFFKDVLHCPNALYLDGNISGLYLPSSSFDSMGNYAGMIGIVQ